MNLFMFNHPQNNNDQRRQPTIQTLYPNYTPEEQTEAEDTLKRYLNLVWRIYSRIQRENPEKLTKELLNARFKHSRR